MNLGKNLAICYESARKSSLYNISRQPLICMITATYFWSLKQAPLSRLQTLLLEETICHFACHPIPSYNKSVNQGRDTTIYGKR